MKYQRFLRCGYAVMLPILLSFSALADGDLDPGFAPWIFRAGQVSAILAQSDGKILIAGEFKTVNGVKANGGAIDGPGPIVANGMVYVTSGYVSLIGRPGNVLLAFGAD